MRIGTRPCKLCRRGIGESPIPVVQDPARVAGSDTGVVPGRETKLTPRREDRHPRRSWISLGSMAAGQMHTLDWSQNILEPHKPGWKPAAGDAPATPQHTVKSVVKATGEPTPEPAAGAKSKPWAKPASELTSRGVGRGQVIAERLQRIANMGLAAASRFTGDERNHKKKLESRKAGFPTPEEREARRCREKHKDWVVNHKDESIGERYHSIKRQIHRYDSEIRSLRFFQLDNHIDLACQVLAIADWAEEFNELSHNPILEILEALLIPYRGSKKAQGQFPLATILRRNPGSLMCGPGHKQFGLTCVPSCSTSRMTWLHRGGCPVWWEDP